MGVTVFETQEGQVSRSSAAVASLVLLTGTAVLWAATPPRVPRSTSGLDWMPSELLYTASDWQEMRDSAWSLAQLMAGHGCSYSFSHNNNTFAGLVYLDLAADFGFATMRSHGVADAGEIPGTQ